MLRFLDVVREMRPTTSNLEDKFDETSGEENQLQETGSESSNSNSKPGSRKTQSMTLFQRSLINSMEKSSQDDNDSDKQFLLSLLPQMKKMSEAQNFDFRLDVMNLVKKYRFVTTNTVQQYNILSDQCNYEQNRSPLPQTSQFEHGGYYTTDYYTDSPQSASSRVSADEDIEALMQS
ncbi:hypothetical protein HW555_013701 [Spodoptera exigua]|uniref:BESS domain-containing protein n=1 Tax=Spodoptera exigua TaxID=7107 RepID=A0A835G104_SPOEX|nr:hypothetical protein HW555_013701 [Spodoptera exigua]